MTKRRMPLGGKILVGWWLIVVGGGLIFNCWMALIFFDHGGIFGGIVFSACAIGCVVYLYRTYLSWDEFPRH